MEGVVDGLRVDMLGVTVGVVAGLLTVGLCHYRSNVVTFLRVAELEHLLDVHPLREPR